MGFRSEDKGAVKPLTLRADGLTDIGRVRANNEDALLVAPRLGVFAVADGMGGHRVGEIASRLAIAAVERHIAERGPAKGHEAVVGTIQAAHRAVRAAVRDDPDLAGMGCALLVAVWDGQRLHLGHAGDVRAYLIREGDIAQVTQEHSVAAELVRGGYLSAEQAWSHPLRHRLTRAVGTGEEVKPEYTGWPVQAGDQVILCSDGLWEMLDDEAILATALPQAGPAGCCRTLVEAANRAGGKDNITVVAIYVD